MIYTETLENLKVETMTLQELASLFRGVGISTTADKLGNAIEQGVYPFAVCIKGNGKNRQFEIYKKMAVEYLIDRATPARTNYACGQAVTKGKAG